VADLAVDSVFAGCRIEAVAGRGGMGIVYRATQLPLGRAVALKLVSPERAADPSFHARFERESRLAAAIDHPNVIPVYDAGEEDGRLYIVMRWVRGTDLEALLSASGGIDPRRAAAIIAHVGDALEAAHAAGLVHRDVKPANVLITGEDGSGHVYLSDFGLTREISTDTRLTESGEWLGTVNFMAPEQFEGGRADDRTDVYALGCVLFAALTGRAPFSGRTVAATMLGHLDEPPPRPSATAGVPEAFDAVVAQAMAKRPADRYPSAAAMAGAALAAAGSRPTGGRAVTRNGAAGPEMPEGAASSAAGGTGTTKVLWASDPAGEPSGTARLVRTSRGPTRTAMLAGGAAALAAVVAAAVVATGAVGGDDQAGPVSENEVREAVDGFAGAYADEDAEAMANVLTDDVARVAPGDSQRGRGAVVRVYRRQFAGNETRDYRLTGLELRAGAVGRASGRYVVSRADRAPLRGRVVFGVRRDEGRPRVGLIAVTPRS
jgi:ketosteroid isomerase-like protein